jgi:predicted CoA-substrate-specific enzyme activase
VRLGMDVGSKTAKVVFLGEDDRVRWSFYEPHRADIRGTLARALERAIREIGDMPVTVCVTGSGAMRLSERLSLPFVQEVVADKQAIEVFAPQADVAIELGGEDAKIMYLRDGVEQRMNSSCAGGTGAFIDHMAALLRTNAEGLGRLAYGGQALYPIASRCGVYAQADVRPLLEEGVRKADIADSVLRSIVTQTLSDLACGRPIRGNVAFLGGPLHHQSWLVWRFRNALGLSAKQVIRPQNAHLFAAMGAALNPDCSDAIAVSEVLRRLEELPDADGSDAPHLPPLFDTAEDRAAFEARHAGNHVRRGTGGMRGEVFLGIDAGSTTVKLAAVGEEGELLYSAYRPSRGNMLGTVRELLDGFYAAIPCAYGGVPLARIGHATVTGYGEALLLTGLRADSGEVETVAHLRAARELVPDVDSVVDIGGQDMKYLRVRDGIIDSVVLNEACSSGCGSFIEGFAYALQVRPPQFAATAFAAERPVDLGSRCTVFMTSRVKQAQREGANASDIAAGLAYSVVKNALYKVVRLRNPQELGEKVVVQGGTFLNDAVLRAFELLTGREVIRPDISGIMGAYGAALLARERATGKGSTLLGREELAALEPVHQTAYCRRCPNTCLLTITDFGVDPETGRRLRFISGNRCEKGAGAETAGENAPDLVAYKYALLFGRESLAEKDAPRGSVGIPRALNMYENYPFWHTFFTSLGYRVVLSCGSTRQTRDSGSESIFSENACYPAKLSHGHIMDLIGQGVDFIWMPCIKSERREDGGADDHYNCPVVTAYPEGLRLNVDEIRTGKVRFLSPYLPYDREELLAESLFAELAEKRGDAVAADSVSAASSAPTRDEIERALDRAWAADRATKEAIRRKGEETLAWIEEHDAHGIVLAGHPYHIDPEIGHGINGLITSYGFAVLTEDSVSHLAEPERPVGLRDQWTYHSRLSSAARFSATRGDLDMIRLTSFGCGIDAIVGDEVTEILQRSGKIATVFKVDEMSSAGTLRIRVRSLFAAIEGRRAGGGDVGVQAPALVPAIAPEAPSAEQPRAEQPRAERPSAGRMREEAFTILCPQIAPVHMGLVGQVLRNAGYDFEVLPTIDPGAHEAGMAHVNNDVCYPLMLETGQILNALASGRYDLGRVAVLVPDSGGSCLASNCGSVARRAMRDAGYSEVPVISFEASELVSLRTSLKVPLRVLHRLAMAVTLGDVLSQCLLATRPNEAEKGRAEQLFREWMACAQEGLGTLGFLGFRRMVRGIVGDFDRVPLADGPVRSRIGIVGGSYVRFNPAANNGLVETVESEGCEAVVPALTDSLLYGMTGAINDCGIGASRRSAVVAAALVRLGELYRSPWAHAARASEHFRPPTPILELRDKASAVLSPCNSMGEGWLLAAEMIDLIENGVPDIVLAQAFACLPNHVAGKGVMGELRRRYPAANIVSLEYDPAASEMNRLNRLKLMMATAYSNRSGTEAREEGR